jgi:hypothetical protein
MLVFSWRPVAGLPLGGCCCSRSMALARRALPADPLPVNALTTAELDELFASGVSDEKLKRGRSGLALGAQRPAFAGLCSWRGPDSNPPTFGAW